MTESDVEAEVDSQAASLWRWWSSVRVVGWDLGGRLMERRRYFEEAMADLI